MARHINHQAKSRKDNWILLKFTKYFHLKQAESHLNPIRISKYLFEPRFNSSGTIRNVLGTYLLMEIDTAIVKKSSCKTT